MLLIIDFSSPLRLIVRLERDPLVGLLTPPPPIPLIQARRLAAASPSVTKALPAKSNKASHEPVTGRRKEAAPKHDKRKCPVCKKRELSARQKTCSAACKQKAYRARQAK
jgi:hypothetical protein